MNFSLSVYYKDIGNYLSREEKLVKIKDAGSIHGITDWQKKYPDKKHYWLDQPGKASKLFERYIPIGSKGGKKGKDENVIFKIYSSGVKTNRDVWAYNSSAENLGTNVRRHIDYCNEQDLNDFKIEPKRGKFDGEIEDKLRRLGTGMIFEEDKIRTSMYRPFVKRYLYFDKILNLRQYLIPLMFPKNNTRNFIIAVLYRFDSNFSTFITNTTPDVQLMQNGQCFPLYIYDKDGNRKDNITNYALQIFHHYYENNEITKMDIFHYVYAMLHHTGYRKIFANVLTRELPRMPLVPNFAKFVRIGSDLAKLHLEYEDGHTYSLGNPLNPIPDSPKTIKFDDRLDLRISHDAQPKTLMLSIDDTKIYENIPVISYRVNGYTPLKWFAVKSKFIKDKVTDITNYSLRKKNGEEIRKIIERLVYVGVESDRLMTELAEANFEQREWTPAKVGLDVHMPDGSGNEFQSRLA